MRFKSSFLAAASVLSIFLPAPDLSAKPTRRPNIVLIVADSLRADHMGIHGYERDTTPVLDRFGRENVLFTRAVSASNWTPVSIASMFTGLYPSSHGMIPPTHQPGKAFGFSVRLNHDFDTLAEILKRGGYQTAGVITNPWIKEEFGFAQGFDDGAFVNMTAKSADAVMESAIGILATFEKKKEPFFLYLHLMDTHKPYNKRSPFTRLFQEPLKNSRYPADVEETLRFYDGAIRFADAQIGELFEELRLRGLYRDALIIVTADHGEQFMERGYYGHGGRLYDEEIHIPLIVKSGASPHAVGEAVSNIDIFSAILDVARLDIPAGVSAVPLGRERGLRKRKGVLSECFLNSYQRAFISNAGKKIIIDYGPSFRPDNPDSMGMMSASRVEGVFDLESDPLEKSPLKDKRLEDELRKELEAILRLALRLKKAVEEGVIPGKTLEELQSLGYTK